MIYVITSVLNGWDNLRPPAAPADELVRYICFTNVPNLPRVFPWEYRPAYPLPHAARAARVAKILPHLMLPADAEYSIYHDGNFQLRQDPRKIIAELLPIHDWAAHHHPARCCIYDEANVLLNEKIGTPRLIEEEIARYRAEDFPAQSGLWANGLLVRRHTPEVAALNERWWQLYAAGCERDQLSFPVARRQLDLTINTISGNIYASPYILNRWHAAFKVRDDNPDYWPERAKLRARLAELARITGSDGGINYPEY